jgi:N-hydroxyarylamine O-acetyltransferase
MSLDFTYSLKETGSSRQNIFDLQAYLARIGYTGNLQPTHDTLKGLHLAHASHIPFENLDIFLNRPIRLDLESLCAKLVQGGRGGYCFEQNLLFLAVLKELGFSVTALAARVRYRAQRVLPRTHMLMMVQVDGARWIADVGFGGEGLLLPIPFGARETARQFLWTYRVIEEAGQWVLQSLRNGAWVDLYAFTLEPQLLEDYEMANYYTSTHPDSRLAQTLTVQLSTPRERTTLINRELIEDRGDTVTSRIIPDDEPLLAILAERFGLRFPPGTWFHIPGNGS